MRTRTISDNFNDDTDLAALAAFRTDLPDGDRMALARARHRLLERADAEHQPARRRRALRPMRRLAIAVTAVAAITAGALAVDTTDLPVRERGASAEAAELLNRAADAAIGAKDPVVRPGQYLRVRTTAVAGAGALVPASGPSAPPGGDLFWLETEKLELYVPGDPAAEWVLRRSGRTPTRFVSPADERKIRDAGLVDPSDLAGTFRARDGAFYDGAVTASWQTPTPAWLATLPRDPDALLDRIYRDSKGAGNSKDGEALVVVADVLRSGIVPGDLRAALFRAATRIPGVEVLDGQAVLDGRRGVAVGRYESEGGQRHEIVFDPETGQVIGERTVAVTAESAGGFPPGTAVSSTAVRTDVVSSAP